MSYRGVTPLCETTVGDGYVERGCQGADRFAVPGKAGCSGREGSSHEFSCQCEGDRCNDPATAEKGLYIVVCFMEYLVNV